MAYLDDKLIDELKRKNDIVSVVSKYAVLKRRGQSNYWACCPFPGHSEKTPSFSVNEPGQFCHCFGCGKGGDVIKFIQEVENLDFYEAVKFLADSCGMVLPESDDYNEEKSKEQKLKKDRLYDVLKETALFYVNNLKSEKAKPLVEYLKKRGVSSSTARAFGLGASLGYKELPKYLAEKGYTQEEMLMAGVCKKNEKDGTLFDFEANRLTFPIINSLGKVIAFGGRILQDKGFGKYLNTSETIIFNKKRNLYAVNNLKKVQLQEKLDYVIMVEGYMDTIALYQAGFKNVVASMGTSLTIEQAKILKRYTDKVVVCYDGDLAGQKATVRSLDIFANEGFEIRVVNLPEGKDPDEVIKELGVDTYKRLIETADPLIDFKLRLISADKNLKDTVDKRKYVSESLELIRGVEDAFLREELLKKVRDKSGITYESLKRDLEKNNLKQERLTDREITATTKKPSKPKNTNAQTFILSAVLQKRDYTLDFDLQSLYFEGEMVNALVDYVLDNPDFKVESLYNVVGDFGREQLFEILNFGESVFGSEGEQRYFNDCVKKVKRENLESDIKRLTQNYTTETDIEKREQIAKMIQKITNKLYEI